MRGTSWVGGAAGHGRLRGSLAPRRAEAGPASEPQDSGEDTEAALRARVAELEQRLSSKAPPPPKPSASAGADVQVAPVILAAYEAAVQDLPELQQAIDARMGKLPDGEYVWKQGDGAKAKDTAIYKRKYEVLGMALNQQETYMKAFGRAVKAAKKSEAMKKVVELWEKGGGGLSKTEARRDFEALQGNDPVATLLLKDVLPEVMQNPLTTALSGLTATALLLLATVGCCLCFFPPLPPVDI